MPETSSTTKPDLRFTLIQPEVVWEHPDENRSRYEALIKNEAEKGRLEVVLLPEMFATGFSMNTGALAEGITSAYSAQLDPAETELERAAAAGEEHTVLRYELLPESRSRGRRTRVSARISSTARMTADRGWRSCAL